MPKISHFYGILIQMFFNDHAPPHFHATYGDAKAVIDIGQLKIIRGKLPRTAKRLVLKWAALHQDALILNWHLCEKSLTPNLVQPLD